MSETAPDPRRRLKKLTSGLSFKAGILALGKTVKRSFATVTALFLVRLLTKEDFGTYKQVMFLIGIFGLMTEFGLPKSLLYFVPKSRDPREKQAFISQSYVLVLALGLAAAAALFFSAGVFARAFDNPALGRLLRIYSPALVFFGVSKNLFSTTLISLERHGTAAFSQALLGLPNALCVLVAAIAGLPLDWIFGVSLGVLFVQYLVLIGLLVKWRIRVFSIPDSRRLKEQASYVLPVSVALVSGLLAVEIDRFVIGLHFDASTFAIYSVAAMQIPFVTNLFEGITSTVVPRIAAFDAEGKKEETARLIRRGTRKVGLLMIPLFVFLFVNSRDFIALLFTSDFLDAVPVFRIYLLVVLMKISLSGSILVGTGKTKEASQISVFTTAVNVAANFGLVRVLGIIGPAIATVGSRILHQAMFLVYLNRSMGYSLRSLVPARGLLMIAAAASASALATAPVSMLGFPLIASLPLSAALFGSLYLVILFLLNVLEPGERALITESAGALHLRLGNILARESHRT